MTCVQYCTLWARRTLRKSHKKVGGIRGSNPVTEDILSTAGRWESSDVIAEILVAPEKNMHGIHPCLRFISNQRLLSYSINRVFLKGDESTKPLTTSACPITKSLWAITAACFPDVSACRSAQSLTLWLNGFRRVNLVRVSPSQFEDALGYRPSTKIIYIE